MSAMRPRLPLMMTVQKTKSNGYQGQHMSKSRTGMQHKVNSVNVRLHVATTWFESPCCSSICLLARGTVSPLAFTSSDMCAAASEPPRAKTTLSCLVVIVRDNENVRDKDVSQDIYVPYHQRKAHGAPSSEISKFQQSRLGGNVGAICPKNDDVHEEAANM